MLSIAPTFLRFGDFFCRICFTYGIELKSNILAVTSNHRCNIVLIMSIMKSMHRYQIFAYNL